MWNKLKQRLQKPIRNQWEKAAVIATSVGLPVGIYFAITSLDNRYKASLKNVAAEGHWSTTKVYSMMGGAAFATASFLLHSGYRRVKPRWQQSKSIQKSWKVATEATFYGFIGGGLLWLSYDLGKDAKESFGEIQKIAQQTKKSAQQTKKANKEYNERKILRVEDHVDELKRRVSKLELK
jgi:hypothetical protein